MIIPDAILLEWASDNGVSPFDEALINPASIDVRWSGRVRKARGRLNTVVDFRTFQEGTREEQEAILDDLFLPVHEADAYQFEPGNFYLIDTLETIQVPHSWRGCVFLKSTAARLGQELLHAGFIDPGYQGTITMQMVFTWTTLLHKGDRIAQVEMNKMVREPTNAYAGRYMNASVPC